MNLTNTGLALAFSAIAAFGQNSQTGAATATKPPMPTKLKFLTPAEIDPSRLLPPPAKDGSSAQQREMAEALSRRRGVILVECQAIPIAVTDFRKRSFPSA
ncbi:MAG TPA: hypothetical protein VK638_55795, partial [Edaphobacter sp.]|nr:hypothetical protein [Edaphobacter sp.]